MKSNSDDLARSLWGDLFPEIQKGTFAAAAFYFADASRAEGQTAQERFFEVWKGMEELGSPAPSGGARRALKKFLNPPVNSGEPTEEAYQSEGNTIVDITTTQDIQEFEEAEAPSE